MTIAIRVAVALLLAAGAWLCWREARLVDRAADARMALALLRYDDDRPGGACAGRSPTSCSTDARPLAGRARRERATADYWRGRYTDAMDIGRQEIDPDLLLIAANASFRASQREGGAGQAACAAARRRAAGVRRRAQGRAATRRGRLQLRIRRTRARRAGASGRRQGEARRSQRHCRRVTRPAIFRRDPRCTDDPGAPPPEVKAEDFKIIAPMEFGDREAQPEPTPGGKLPRKG